ncbi:ABC transporter E family member 2-like [Papaver somniferum]|uniref:ABC transporter E family member 2-like n=1 Tax=Papaver somniferum TaxID=3469 RepID=UPI000E701211|nr:ABC transporter E family member 2-like [Papaver somniferum]XP_026438916.1 ABC transporter E family member 2-like [Papaver somniferum]XP_026438917.1 ABC transporter E family member 2-like [Papaver somniferum]XP_026438918.1 ABC transporter E family member 2-like [Papaver somniferum]
MFLSWKEQPIVSPKAIKRFILYAKKTAFVVEHDFIMATYHADRVIVFEGRPSIDSTANAPQSLLTGMKLILSQLDITFRCDPTNFRPRLTSWNPQKTRSKMLLGPFITSTKAYQRSSFINWILWTGSNQYRLMD